MGPHAGDDERDGVWVHWRKHGRGGGRDDCAGGGPIGWRRGNPLIIVAASGGARMMEGIVSLMQMAKISAGLARLDDAEDSVHLGDDRPDDGWITASFAMLGDLNIAEPGR